MRINIEVSARHIHLSAADCITLFGDAELVKRNDLSQIGEYATDRTVEIAGPDRQFHHVRVLGPLRKNSQLEISFSDARYLGLEAPLALSGQGVGCEVKVVGPKGSIQSNIAMVAKRHLHLSSKTAQKLKLKNNNTVKARIYGERGTTFDNIIVRVADNFVDSIHLDTDEGNASGLGRSGSGELIVR